jgi:hypothetical protein
MDSTTGARASVPTTFHALGERVLVEQEPGLPPAEAEILQHNFHRPHLVKVSYARRSTAEWIFRSRIAGPVHFPG